MRVKTLVCALLGLCLAGEVVNAQPTNITYQGRLTDAGTLASTNYSMVFYVYDAAEGGSIVAGPTTNALVTTSNGLFTTLVNVGPLAFVYGYDRWIEIGVRPYGDTNAFTILSPRQYVSSAPYALRSLNSGFATTAGTASALSGSIPGTSITSTVPDVRLSTNVAFLNTNLTFKGSLTATQFIGNGLGLTNIPISGVKGTLPDSQLSANVALLGGNATFNGTVTATNFSGLGAGLTNVPGRLFDFIPTGADIQATDNNGYLATNSSTPVVVTLPASPKLGTTVRVSGGAPGGWIVAQNEGQSILAGGLVQGLGLAWTQRDTGRSWKSVAISADGKKQVAVVTSSTKIYYSTNYGVTWNASTTTFGSLTWQSVTCSADGSRMVAVATGNKPYLSTDFGANWGSMSAGTSGNWTAIASSVDGSRLVGTISGSSIQVSANSGASWTTVSATKSWTGAACSADGMTMVVCATGDYIYTSSNGGSTWTMRDSSRGWSSVACSADGTIMVATVTSGSIYTSYDSGVTWAPTGPGSQSWTGVGCSGDGSKMVAVYSLGGIYFSNDAGLTWAATGGSLSSYGWKCAAVSQDGSTAVAAATSQPLYVYSKSSTTTGTTGYLSGTFQSAVELQYIGNGVFMPISHMGNIGIH